MGIIVTYFSLAGRHGSLLFFLVLALFLLYR